MPVHVKIIITQKINTDSQIVQVCNDGLGGIVMVVKEADNEQDYRNLYLTKDEALAVARMLTDLASK